MELRNLEWGESALLRRQTWEIQPYFHDIIRVYGKSGLLAAVLFVVVKTLYATGHFMLVKRLFYKLDH